MNDHPSSCSLRCKCGHLTLPAVGQPILTVSCYCSSCQEAARRLSPADTSRMVGRDGGTPFVLYRKDRVDFSGSKDALREYRLTPKSPTRRVFASCCGAPMFLEFQNGHWVSVYSSRLPEAQRPPIAMRVVTADAPPGTHFDDRIPTYKTHSARFMARLLWAWVKMGFRSPDIAVAGELIVTGLGPAPSGE